MTQAIPQEIKDRLMRKWGTHEAVIKIKNNVVTITGALTIGEPPALLNDLRLAGFVEHGRSSLILADGTHLRQLWQYSAKRAAQIQWEADDQMRSLGIPEDFTGE